MWSKFDGTPVFYISSDTILKEILIAQNIKSSVVKTLNKTKIGSTSIPVPFIWESSLGRGPLAI